VLYFLRRCCVAADESSQSRDWLSAPIQSSSPLATERQILDRVTFSQCLTPKRPERRQIQPNSYFRGPWIAIPREPTQGIFMCKKISALILSAFLMQPAHAGAHEGEVYVMGGTGQTSEGSSTGVQGLQIGAREKISTYGSLGAMYYNEGTPKNNHRDGFGFLTWYDQPMSNALNINVGAGPYFAMNTTTVDGQQRNQKDLGALAAIAVLYRIYGTHFNLRAQYTRAQVPGSVASDTIFVGVGYSFDEKPPEKSIAEQNIEFSVWGGNSHTTRAGADMVHGFQVEVKKIVTDHIAYSVSIIDEGNTGVTDREGVVGQVWYAVQSDKDWNFSVGAGPYIAYDRIEGRTHLVGVASVRITKKISKEVRIGFTFNRVVTGNDRDQDMFLIGIQKDF
jgi:hypothetical protein